MSAESAGDRLRRLQAQHGLTTLPDDRLEALRDTLSPRQAASVLGTVDRAEVLLKALGPGLPEELRSAVADRRVIVGEVGLPTPVAYVDRAAGNGFLVVMHSGLFEFLYRIARPLSAAIFRTQEDEDRGIETPDFARIVCEIFWWQQRTGTSFGPEYDVTDDQKKLANVLAHHAEMFLLAHELGHVFVALMSPPESIDGQEEEHAADLVALRVLMSAQADVVKRQGGFWLSLVYAGVELALQIWDVMERLGIPFVDSVHPPARARLDLLRSGFREHFAAQAHFEQAVAPARLIERAFDDACRIVTQDGGEHAQLFEQETAALLGEFEMLFERCTKGPVPDYFHFYPGARDLLRRGYPHEILNNVFEKVVASFHDEVRAAPAGPARAGDLLRRFNSYKLLLGLTDNLPEPAKSLFKSAFDRAGARRPA